MEAQFGVKLESDDHDVIRKILKNIDIAELFKTANPKDLIYFALYI